MKKAVTKGGITVTIVDNDPYEFFDIFLQKLPELSLDRVKRYISLPVAVDLFVSGGGSIELNRSNGELEKTNPNGNAEIDWDAWKIENAKLIQFVHDCIKAESYTKLKHPSIVYKKLDRKDLRAYTSEIARRLEFFDAEDLLKTYSNLEPGFNYLESWNEMSKDVKAAKIDQSNHLWWSFIDKDSTRTLYYEAQFSDLVIKALKLSNKKLNPQRLLFSLGDDKFVTIIYTIEPSVTKKGIGLVSKVYLPFKTAPLPDMDAIQQFLIDQMKKVKI